MAVLIALSLLAAQKSAPYSVLAVTEARSPQPVHARLIRSKREAFDFFFLVKEGAPKPMALKKIDWRKNSVLAVYPGLLSTESTLTPTGLARRGMVLQPSVVVQNERGEPTKYPILLLKVARQGPGVTAADVMLMRPKIEIKVSD